MGLLVSVVQCSVAGSEAMPPPQNNKDAQQASPKTLVPCLCLVCFIETNNETKRRQSYSKRLCCVTNGGSAVAQPLVGHRQPCQLKTPKGLCVSNPFGLSYIFSTNNCVTCTVVFQ